MREFSVRRAVHLINKNPFFYKAHCPVCGESFVFLLRAFYKPKVVKCLGCTAYLALPLPCGSITGLTEGASSSATESSYYQTITESFETQKQIAREKVPLLLQYWEKQLGRRPCSVLDVGAGTGAYGPAFLEQGVDWRGMEVNPQMLEFTAQKGLPVIHADATLERLDLGKTFDVAFSSQVLEHVFKPEIFLANVSSNLVQDGLLHLDVPNNNSLTSTVRKLIYFGRDFGFIQPMHHLIAYNKRALGKLLSQSPFEPLLIDDFPNDHPLMGQLISPPRGIHKWVLKCSSLAGHNSLLVAVAKKRSVSIL